jgi:hypothetical protein
MVKKVKKKVTKKPILKKTKATRILYVRDLDVKTYKAIKRLAFEKDCNLSVVLKDLVAGK